jgi:hypothetical protein
MRLVAALVLALAAAISRADRVLLIPLDSRPAAGQFAQMIGRIAGLDVRMPPYQTLGRFTQPGDPIKILEWLNEQDLSDVRAIVASTDMIAYGGLIASRLNDIDEEDAIIRLRKLLEIKRRSPRTKLYLFSSTMRLAPTSTRDTESWRMILAKYEEARDKAVRLGDADARATMNRTLPKIPLNELKSYEAARHRDHDVQETLIRMTARGSDIEYLVIGQDDARPFGPHVPETALLRRLADLFRINDRVYFCEGVDQDANVLMSRALVHETGWVPKVRVVYSDDAAKTKYAAYEALTIEHSLREQLLASGALPADPDGEYDYSLYLNVPNPAPEKFEEFMTNLKSEVDQGFPVAVADINLGEASADPQLIAGLMENARGMKLLSFAGWNTAGNSIGTAIPAANVYLLARRLQVDPLVREVAQREFLLHRFVNDFDYHRFTRPKAYAFLKSIGSSKEEVSGRAFDDLNALVAADLGSYLTATFRDQLLGKHFFAGASEYQFTDLSDVKIFLPWPRAYEVRMDFHLVTQPVNVPGGSH